MVSLLGDKECGDLHELAVEVLGLCLGDTNSMYVLQGSGCLHQLISNITESSNPQMKKCAISTLASAATECEHVWMPRRSHLLVPFVSLVFCSTE